MTPQTITFFPKHWDEQKQIAKSADLRNATLRTSALLFLSSAIAVFAVMTTASMPALLATLSATAIGKVLAIVGFNLFAGYMLVDALSEFRQLCYLRWRCQVVKAELISLDGEMFKRTAVFKTAPKQPLPLEIGFQFVCPETKQTLMDSRQVQLQVRPKTNLPQVGDQILLQYVNPSLYVVL